MIQNYINHIALVVDRSGSMSNVANKVVEVFDNEIAYLRRRSQELNQETRVSVYLFDDKVECLVFDMDVMRMPSLKGHYSVRGSTALLDGVHKAIVDMKQLPELYGDHAFLLYSLTDGEENASKRITATALSAMLSELPEHWTVVCLVPDSRGIHEAKKFGFPAPNIQVWSTSREGVETVGQNFRAAMDNYFTLRQQGVRGTKNFFTVDLSSVSAKDVKTSLSELPASDYQTFPVQKKVQIKDFVESWTKRPYVKGSSYYELNKPETVQAYKEVCIQDRANGKVYAGQQARQLLSLPTYDTRVTPGDHGKWRIFIQSTSVNRNLLPGTFVLVRF